MTLARIQLSFTLMVMAIRIGIFLYIHRLAYHYTKSQHSVQSRRHGISHGYHAKPTRALERYGIRPTSAVRLIKAQPIIPSVDTKLLVA